MIILLIEHIVAYLFNIYRNWELKKRGTPTTLGIETAPCESRLKLLEIVADFVIIVVVLIHFIKAGTETFNDNPLNNFWILTDLIIMFISLIIDFHYHIDLDKTLSRLIESRLKLQG